MHLPLKSLDAPGSGEVCGVGHGGVRTSLWSWGHRKRYGMWNSSRVDRKGDKMCMYIYIYIYIIWKNNNEKEKEKRIRKPTCAFSWCCNHSIHGYFMEPWRYFFIFCYQWTLPCYVVPWVHGKPRPAQELWSPLELAKESSIVSSSISDCLPHHVNVGKWPWVQKTLGLYTV